MSETVPPGNHAVSALLFVLVLGPLALAELLKIIFSILSHSLVCTAKSN